VAEREADDAVLKPGLGLIRHRREAALSRPQHLEAVALDAGLPSVVARAVALE
jgi:hypothetical protein